MRLEVGPCNYRLRVWLTPAETLAWSAVTRRPNSMLRDKQVYVEYDVCGMTDWLIDNRMPQWLDKHDLADMLRDLVPPAAAREGIVDNLGLNIMAAPANA